MKKKQGFTLIELLAVIIILVIIALITTPLILNVINDSKEKSRLRSIENIENQAYFYYTKYSLVNDKLTGNIFNQVMETIKGEKPESGEIFIKAGKQIGYALKYDNICYKKGYSESVVRKLENEEECTLVNTKNYLKKAEYKNQDSTFLGGPIAKKTVESISFLGNQEMGENVIDSWDVSQQENNSILAWYKDEDSNGLYEVYIGGDGMVVANPYSSYLFYEFANMTTLNLQNLYTGIVENMERMFNCCYKLLELDLSFFDTSKVTNMKSMFSSCDSLTSLDLKSFDTRNVIDMHDLFWSCDNLTTVDVSSFDTSKVTNMIGMFGVTNIERLDLSNFNTSNVTNMASMFDRCTKLIELNISSFDTSKVTDMRSMFSGCSSLKALDVTHFDTTNVSIMISMFLKCSSLKELDLSSFTTNSIATSTNMGGLFQDCKNLETLNISKFNRVTSMFSGCSNLKTVYANETIKNDLQTRFTGSGITGVNIVV